MVYSWVYHILNNETSSVGWFCCSGPSERQKTPLMYPDTKDMKPLEVVFFWNGVWKWGRGTYTPQMVIFSGNMEHDDHTLFSQIIMILTSLFLAVFSWIKKRNVIAQPVFSISPDLKPQYLPIESATSCSIPHWKHGISLRPSSNWLAKPPYLVRR